MGRGQGPTVPVQAVNVTHVGCCGEWRGTAVVCTSAGWKQRLSFAAEFGTGCDVRPVVFGREPPDVTFGSN